MKMQEEKEIRVAEEWGEGGGECEWVGEANHSTFKDSGMSSSEEARRLSAERRGRGGGG